LKIALLHQQTTPPVASTTAFFTHTREIQHRLTMITHPIPTPRRLTRILVGLAASAAAGVAFSQAPKETPKPAGPGQPASADAAATVLDTPGLPTPPAAPEKTVDPAASPRASIVEPERPAPSSELEQLRQEVQTLRQESALLKAQLQTSPVDPQAQLESLLLTAELNYVREREEFGARHPRMVAAAKQLDQLKHMLETRKEEQFKKEEMVNVKKNRKVRELAETKARIIQLATQLEPGAALSDAAPEIRRKAYDEMGDLRARAEGLETELRFGLLDD
jgi:hypothetical protein